MTAEAAAEKVEADEVAADRSSAAEAEAWEEKVEEERAAAKAEAEGPAEANAETAVGAELPNFMDDFMKWVAVIFSTGFFSKCANPNPNQP